MRLRKTHKSAMKLAAQLIRAFDVALRIVQSLELSKFSKLLAFFCGFAVWFVSDLVLNPEDRFPCDEAQIHKGMVCLIKLLATKSERHFSYKFVPQKFISSDRNT